MGCCGESIDQPVPEEGNRITPFTSGGAPVNQQPSAQSVPQWQEKGALSSIATPPPVLQYGKPDVGMHQPWASQQANTFNPYDSSTLVSSPVGAFDVNGSFTATHGNFGKTPSPPPSSFSPSQSPPLAHPTAIYAQNQNQVRMTVTGRRTTSPTMQQGFTPTSADEGKISVSIDFGEYVGPP